MKPPLRRSISFDEETFDKVEDWRAKRRPIPDFSRATCDLVKLGLAAEKRGKKK
ncbi:MAG: hypothetical protein ACLP9K_05835 [Nitrososphaerales archaeon]